jgi:hypothetical protein
LSERDLVPPSAAAARAAVLALEASMLALPPERHWDGEAATRHYFAPGIYCRELTIPAGMVVIGKIHMTRHICIVSKGEVSVVTEDGALRIAAPATFVSAPGTKRAVYAHAETVWTNVHPNPDDETDLSRIEARVIAESFEALGGERSRIVIGG